MAALQILKPGDHIVSGIDIYGGTYRIFEQLLRPWGITISYARDESTESYARCLTPETKLIWLESPSNPLLRLSDIRALAEISREKTIRVAVDNTFATPYFQRPLELGADIVVHSTTKYLGGHSDVIGGAIRMKEHEAGALHLARMLESHPAVARVWYPGLPSHPQHDLARRQMSGFSGMITIALKGGLPAVEHLLHRTKLFTLADSLGGVESLAASPAKMTLGALSQQERDKRGCTDNLLRLSVGLEHPGDLEADLDQALEGIPV